jgi:precorrin-2 dehydrogenase / sirohydrochlorin ferrochelatase
MKIYYPVGLDLTGKAVLVVGGGQIADGKIDALLASEALITIVSPDVTPRLATLADQGHLTWVRRDFTATDADGAWIVIAATDRRDVNAEVAAVARAAGRLVNAVDDIPYCDFIAMSVIRRGDLQFAISTGGGSPAMARWVREEFEAILPDEFGPLLAILAEVRAELKASGEVPPYAVWSRAITPSVLNLLAHGRRDEARRMLWQSIAGHTQNLAPTRAGS